MEEKNDGMLQLCAAVWNDYRSGTVDYENLDVGKYSREYKVSKFPKSLIAPVLLKRAEPTSEDAAGLRIEINRYCNKLRRPSKEEAETDMMEEQTAIAVLKKKGYRVMKKTVAYIDL